MLPLCPVPGSHLRVAGMRPGPCAQSPGLLVCNPGDHDHLVPSPSPSGSLVCDPGAQPFTHVSGSLVCDPGHRVPSPSLTSWGGWYATPVPSPSLTSRSTTTTTSRYPVPLRGPILHIVKT
eukprot:1922487-Rhodomonas_salina.1